MRTRVILVLAVLVALVRPALAEDRVAARKAYRTAAKHYDLGEYQEALSAFKEAYRNYEDPSFLFNIGQCQRMLGQNADAVRSFRAYLHQPNPANRVQVEQLIDKLQSEMAAQEAAKKQPPDGTMRPAEAPPTGSEPAPAAVAAPATSPSLAVTSSAPPPKRTPVYKKWWLWTAVGVVAAGVAVGVGVGVSQKSFPTSSTSDGTFRF